MDELQRSHDLPLYLRENRYEEPKEIFKLIGDRLAELKLAKAGATVADIGCAAREFVHYAARRFPEAT